MRCSIRVVDFCGSEDGIQAEKVTIMSNVMDSNTEPPLQVHKHTRIPNPCSPIESSSGNGSNGSAVSLSLSGAPSLFLHSPLPEF
jgi:hypothetical protein